MTKKNLKSGAPGAPLVGTKLGLQCRRCLQEFRTTTVEVQRAGWPLCCGLVPEVGYVEGCIRRPHLHDAFPRKQWRPLAAGAGAVL
jgi:hypothetical protein